MSHVTAQEQQPVVHRRLNLGCGADTRDGWHNVDVVERPDVNEVYDLEETPWPWPTDCAERVLLDNVFEHLHPRTRPAVIRECRRVLADDGTLEMALPVPEIGTGWDVTHYNVPSWRWPLHPEYRDRWELLSVRGSRVGPGRFVPERLARQLTRHGIARCLDEVRIEVRPA